MAVQEQRTLPAQFIEDLGKDLAKQITACPFLYFNENVGA